MSDLTALLTQLRADQAPAATGGGPTGVPGVHFFWMEQDVPRAPLLYDSGLILLAQGRKEGFLGDRRFRYDADTCMAFGVPVPFECASFATPQEPMLGLRIDIDTERLHRLVSRYGEQLEATQAPPSLHTGVEAIPLDGALREAATRLLRMAQDPLDREVLGPGAVDELLYRVLRTPQGRVLYTLTQEHSTYARIAAGLERIHAHYAEPTSVEDLARSCGMSVSAFHRAFKEVTGESPLQYVKKLRLLKAKSLLVHNGARVEQTAYAVGYASPSQFSREFKRYFDVPPSQASTLPYQEPAAAL